MRRWAWKIGRFADIDVFVHATFLLIILWVGISAWAQDGTVAGVVSGIAFILALFATVVAHEFGHALVGPALRHQDARHNALAHRRRGWPGAHA